MGPRHFMYILFTIFLSFFANDARGEPQQVHIAFGSTPDVMAVQWATDEKDLCTVESRVRWGLSVKDLSYEAQGECFPFAPGPEQLNQSHHVAEMSGLSASTTYYYSVGDGEAMSDVFHFRTAPDALTLADNLPQKFLVWGDLGSSAAGPDNSTTIMPWASAELSAQRWDMILHVGDFAYDLDSDGGARGQLFMNEIQNMSAFLPYHVDPGNHEQAFRFAHYTEFFRNQPKNTAHPTVETSNGLAPNNWFFSFNVGLVHFVTLSSEILFHAPALVPAQRAWLEADLIAANKNRSLAPWIIVNAHRPLYCSCDGDCDGAALEMRVVFEHLFYEYGVDLFIAGHEHNYERMFDVAPSFNAAEPWLSGVTTQTTTNPPATTYIVTGDAGNREDHETFTRSQPDRTAFRTDAYGYSRMSVHNSTHLYWEQVECDDSVQPQVDGRVIDAVWIVQEHHGNFSEHSY